MTTQLTEVGVKSASTITFTNLLIFNDGFMFWIALAGGVLSFLNMLLTLSNADFMNEGKEHKLSNLNIALKVVKSLIFGAIAIVFSFLVLKTMGTEYILEILHLNSSKLNISDIRVIDSIFLLMSAVLSWFIIPLIRIAEKRAE